MQSGQDALCAKVRQNETTFVYEKHVSIFDNLPKNPLHIFGAFILEKTRLAIFW